ncbi:MAG: hypothetical protein OFPI_39720 [Osedax symbiont Rs2]|nr:MAG: hypothetical protein OFPI_39720 [Osedax symbiont Rs2]
MVSKRVGRPTIGEEKLSQTEIKRRYRAKLKADGNKASARSISIDVQTFEDIELFCKAFDFPKAHAIRALFHEGMNQHARALNITLEEYRASLKFLGEMRDEIDAEDALPAEERERRDKEYEGQRKQIKAMMDNPDQIQEELKPVLEEYKKIMATNDQLREKVNKC